MARYARFFDSLFTIVAFTWFVVATIWFFKGDIDKGVARMTLALAFWIASTQLAPYWNSKSPERCCFKEGP